MKLEKLLIMSNLHNYETNKRRVTGRLAKLPDQPSAELYVLSHYNAPIKRMHLLYQSFSGQASLHIHFAV